MCYDEKTSGLRPTTVAPLYAECVKIAGALRFWTIVIFSA